VRVTILFITLIVGLSSCHKKEELERVPGIPPFMTQYNIPGYAGVKLDFIQDHEFEYYGVNSREDSIEIDKNTLFEAASLTKPVFAYCIAKMVQQNILSLDSPVFRYINYSGEMNPGLEAPYRDLVNYTTYDSDYKKEDFEKITLRMILSHTSGMRNWWDPRPMIQFNPGMKFSYSGDAYILLQRVLEQYLDKPISDIMEEEVFTPLGMTNAQIKWEGYSGVTVDGHDVNGMKYKEIWKSKEGLVHGSLLCTLDDFVKFLDAVYVERDNMLDGFLSPMVPLNGQYDRLHWGLGFGIEQSGTSYIWHWGDDTYFQNFFAIDIHAGTGILFFTNSENGLKLVEPLTTNRFSNNELQFNQFLNP
jgi:CubicO group peptidase (beta-lactamase class C family)